jgi:hypothetical protein
VYFAARAFRSIERRWLAGAVVQGREHGQPALHGVVDVLAAECAVVADAAAADVGVGDDAVDHVDGGAGLPAVAFAGGHGGDVEDHPVVADGVGAGAEHGEFCAVTEFGVGVAVLGLDAGMDVASALFSPAVGGGLAYRRGDDGAIAHDVLGAERVGVGYRSGRVEAAESAREPAR